MSHLIITPEAIAGRHGWSWELDGAHERLLAAADAALARTPVGAPKRVDVVLSLDGALTVLLPAWHLAKGEAPAACPDAWAEDAFPDECILIQRDVQRRPVAVHGQVDGPCMVTGFGPGECALHELACAAVAWGQRARTEARFRAPAGR